MQIRRRKSRDLGRCTRLLRLVMFEGRFPDASRRHPRAWLEGDDVLDAWVAVAEGHLLGHVALSRLGEDRSSVYRWRELTGREPDQLACVSRLYVRPRARGRGIGTALLETAAAGAHERGLAPVLESVSDRRGGLELLDGAGWRQLAVDHRNGGPAGLRVHRYLGPPVLAALR